MKQFLSVLIFLFLTVSSAHAIIINGDTTGEPTWNRPIQGGPTLSGVGTAVPYEVTAFSVDTSGSYLLEIITATSSWDTYLHLYTSFDPLDQLTGLIDGNDDGGIGFLSSLTSSLTSGTNYYAVVSGFSNSSFGSYSLEITGPGNVSVPTPTTLALMFLGVIGLGYSRRKHKYFSN